MIIVEKNNYYLSRMNIEEITKTKKAREVMKEILSSLLNLAERVNFDRLLMESLIVEGSELKVDIIPSILKSTLRQKSNIEMEKEQEVV